VTGKRRPVRSKTTQRGAKADLEIAKNKLKEAANRGDSTAKEALKALEEAEAKQTSPEEPDESS
jgi:hypothetical protein